MLSREHALELLLSRDPAPHMRRHALDSEAIMRTLAAHFGEDMELWGLSGLLHDVDYPDTEQTPERHGILARDILAGHAPEELIQAVAAHNSECTGIEPLSLLDKALRPAESVTGMISAAALVRPEGFDGMKVSSLKKKMKDKAFAAAVSRERIRECEELGLPLEEFLTLSIEAVSAARQGNA